MRLSEPEVVIDDLYFPECLRWRNGELWFSDMFGGGVHRASGRPGGRPRTVLHLEDEAGGLGWLPDGSLLVVSMNERRILRFVDGTLRLHTDLSAYFGHPTNDMLVTETGHAYVTGFGFDADHGAPVETVQLAVVEPDGRARIAGSPMVFPNGIDLSRDRQGLVVAETFADVVSYVPVDAQGLLGPARPFATLSRGDGPDGISCDGEGGVWVACAFGRRAVHIDSAGTIDAEIQIPGQGVFDCLLAGPEGRTLYLGVSCPDEELGRLHRTGSVLAVEVVP